MPITDRVSFQLYSARKFPPLDSQLATLCEARLPQRRAVRRPVPESGRAESGAEEAQAQRRRPRISESTGCGATSRRSAKLAKDFGVKELIVPAVRAGGAHQRRRRAGRSSATELAGYQKQLAAHGIDLAWHNHSFEFAKLPDGSYPLDHIFAAAPGLHWQADIGWIAVGGRRSRPPGSRNTRDRVTALHVKDLAPKGRERRGRRPGRCRPWRARLEEADAGDQGAEREVSGDGARQPERLRALRPPVVRNRFRLVGRHSWTKSASELSAAAISRRST